MNKLYFFLLLLPTFVFSQQNLKQTFTLKGKVIDQDTKQPLEYATIILKPLNGKKVNGGITNASGVFNIEAKPGVYNLSIEFISFKSKKINDFKLFKNTDLGNINLKMDAESLNEVEVIAEKSTVEIHLDKKIYNVGKDMTVKGGTASDVLDNVPSVQVDVDGTVSLRGNDNVRILVNGKPSGLVGLTGTDALRQLPAEAIQKVEVITSPSARYDAEGTAGILNIILRKGKALGFNGSISGSAGHPDSFNTAANLNFRTKKINLFTNLGYNYRTPPGNSYNNTSYFDGNENIISNKEENRTYKRKRNSLNTRLGLEYFLTDKSSITNTILYQGALGNDQSINLSNTYDATNILSLTNNRTELNDRNNRTFEYSFNFTQNFKKSNHKLTFNFQYNNTDENNDAAISDEDLFPTLTINNPEKNSTTRNSDSYLIKSDYVLPLKNKAQFEFGFRFDLNKLKSDYLVEDFDPNTNQFYNNTNFSNTLNFKQNIYAVYSQFGKKINKFSYLFGLRMEATNRNINLEQTNETFIRNFTELFPTANFAYEFNESASLTLGYSRRLRRPRHWFLNPFESRTSETFIRKGNINLDPAFSGLFDLGFLKKWNNFSLNSSMYYQHTVNNFEFVQNEETRLIDGVATLIIVRNPINLSSQDRYGFEFNLNYTPFKWWRLNQNFNIYKYQTKGDYQGVNYDANDVSWFTRFNSKITLPNKIEWQTRLMYRGPRRTAVSNRSGMFMTNLAFSKDLFKNKATLSLNISDLFNTRKRKTTDYTNTTITNGEFQWRERQRNYDDGGDSEMFKA
ncbi:MAG: TonB-dependent receptor domain-containing protein [Lutibacter sp.]